MRMQSAPEFQEHRIFDDHFELGKHYFPGSQRVRFGQGCRNNVSFRIGAYTGLPAHLIYSSHGHQQRIGCVEFIQVMIFHNITIDTRYAPFLHQVVSYLALASQMSLSATDCTRRPKARAAPCPTAAG